MRKLIAQLDPVPVMNLIEANADTDSALVCRTCTHAKDRSWLIEHERQIELIKAGESLADHGCAPDRQFATYRLVNNGTIAPIDESRDLNAPKTEAIVTTCGWTQANKCQRCAHFAERTVQVWREAYEGGPLRPRNMVVGGHCKLGADEPCVPKPIVGRRLDPSCANCKFLYSTHSWHYSEDFGRTVGDIELDPWIRKQAILAAYGQLDAKSAKAIGIDYNAFDANGKSSIGLAIYLARMHTHGKVGGSGMVTRRVRIVTTRWKLPPEGTMITGVDACALTPAEYVVQFDVTDNRHFTIDATRDDVYVLPLPVGRGNQAMVTFYGEAAMREFDVRYVARRHVTSWAHFAELDVTEDFVPRNDHADRWWPMCADCKKTPGRACYFHAKGIDRTYKSVHNLDDYEIDVVDPSASDLDIVRLRDEWRLVYVRDAQGVASDIVNPVGKELNRLLWQLNATNLHRLAREAQSRGNHSLTEVFWRINQRMPEAPKTDRPQWMQPSLGREMSNIEPMKYYCALNLHYPDVNDATLGKIFPGRGIDMRLMFGDRFGMERGSVEYSESWSRKEDEAEWMRAHSIEERISEEIDTTLNYVKLTRVDAPKPAPEPLEWHTTQLDISGYRTDDRNYWHDEYDPEHDRANYTEWLDEYDPETHTSNRMAMLGYSMFKGPNEGMYANQRDENIDRPTEFMCVRCDERYGIDQVGAYRMECTRLVGSKDHNDKPKACGGRLVVRTHIKEEELTRSIVRGQKAPDMSTRRRTGREGAVLADSRFFQERNRLARISCPWWELKGGNDLYPTTMAQLGYDVAAMREDWQTVKTSTDSKSSGARQDNYAYFAYASNLETRNYRLWLVGQSMHARGDFYGAMRIARLIMWNR